MLFIFKEYIGDFNDIIVKLIIECMIDMFEKWLMVEDVIEKFYWGKNLYLLEVDEGELFFCGFMDKIDIFVVDFCIDEDVS